MTPGRLYLVRHGRTAGNQVRYVGWGDDPLDETGRAQVRALAADLAAEPIDVVYASPLRRAVDTARPLAETHAAPLHLRDGLKEIDYGAYQDVLKAERKLRLRRNHRVERMPGGESLRDVFDRVAVVRAEVEAELARRAPRRRRRALLEPADARRPGRRPVVRRGSRPGRLLAREWCGYHPFRRGRPVKLS